MQGRVDNESVKVSLVSAYQVILSSQDHNSLNAELVSTNLKSMLVFVLRYEPYFVDPSFILAKLCFHILVL